MKAYQKMIPYLNSRESQLCQEFAVLPTAPPHSEGGIFELRKYQLKPGALLEWEHAWYGLAIFVIGRGVLIAHPAGVGASKHAGNSSRRLERGSHKSAACIRCITCGNTRECAGPRGPSCTLKDPCSDLQARKETREKAWQLEGWSETVTKVCDKCLGPIYN